MRRKKTRCPICKRYYSRAECEFCARERKWEEIILSKKLAIFPKRVIKQFNRKLLQEQKLVKSDYYLQGSIGIGKTLKAARIALKRVRDDYIHGLYTTIGFYNVPELLLRLRATFSENNTETEKSIFDEVIGWDYLILDDIGAEKASEWALQTMYIIINHRYERLQQTIVTSNYDYEELEEHLKSKRLVSRLREMSTLFKVSGKDLRK